MGFTHSPRLRFARHPPPRGGLGCGASRHPPPRGGKGLALRATPLASEWGKGCCSEEMGGRDRSCGAGRNAGFGVPYGALRLRRACGLGFRLALWWSRTLGRVGQGRQRGGRLTANQFVGGAAWVDRGPGCWSGPSIVPNAALIRIDILFHIATFCNHKFGGNCNKFGVSGCGGVPIPVHS